jgi:hypothetical protein
MLINRRYIRALIASAIETWWWVREKKIYFTHMTLTRTHTHACVSPFFAPLSLSLAIHSRPPTFLTCDTITAPRIVSPIDG